LIDPIACEAPCPEENQHSLGGEPDERGSQPPAGRGADASEITARFRDPGGNVLGLYQPHF
jgi:hypothetical protein